MKNYKAANNSATTEARENISRDLESLVFHKNLDACLTKFENHQILLIKISHRFLVTTKLFSGQKCLIKALDLHHLCTLSDNVTDIARQLGHPYP
jgi:hypothetical protein